jgi:hypothetical protein
VQRKHKVTGNGLFIGSGKKGNKCN